jgi:hypothetical protein
MTTVQVQPRHRLGWLGPLLVIIGLAGGAFGIWWMQQVRPVAGKVIDAIALGDDAYVVIRDQQGSSRNFLEMIVAGNVKWQTMIPPYAGRLGSPAIGVGPDTLSVRLVRNGHSEVFGLSISNASKVGSFKIAADRPASPTGHCGKVITLTNGSLSFEVVEGDGWNDIAAVDVTTGVPIWSAKLGAATILDGGFVDDVVWLWNGTATLAFALADGAPKPAPARPVDGTFSPSPRPAPYRVQNSDVMRFVLARDSDGLQAWFNETKRELIVRSSMLTDFHDIIIPWPSDAVAPYAYHFATHSVLVIKPSGVQSIGLKK